jgi:hypothetical protein
MRENTTDQTKRTWRAKLVALGLGLFLLGVVNDLSDGVLGNNTPLPAPMETPEMPALDIPDAPEVIHTPAMPDTGMTP